RHTIFSRDWSSDVCSSDLGREMIIAYLNAGDFFGEMGLFDKEGTERERSAWVRAKTECEVAELSYTKFRELTQQDPDILYALGRSEERRVGKEGSFRSAG